MPENIIIEQTYINIINISCLGKPKGGYRVIRNYLYRPDSKIWKGCWVEKPYLNSRYRLKINLWSKDLIDHKILFTGCYERATNAVLEKYVEKGAFVFEAGANSGTETLLLSRIVGAHGKVYAIEPVPHIVQKLQSNIDLNRLENVTVEALAFGEKAETIPFYISPHDHINQGMGTSSKQHSSDKMEIGVTQVSLDEYCQNNHIPRVDFIKMDIQGAEEMLLKGAKRTIQKHKPIIFLEAGAGWSSFEDLFKILSNYSYNINLIVADGQLHPMKALGELEAGNWLCFPASFSDCDEDARSSN